MSISVVICTYNGAHFLQSQLDSLLSQTRLPDEIVIRDDLSSDGTLEILKAFATAASALGVRVDLARNSTNLGYRKNFERALHAATSELLFLCDQDDVWLPQKLYRFESTFKARPELLALHCDAWLTDENSNRKAHRLFEALEVSHLELHQMHSGQGFNALVRRNFVTGAAMAIRRELLQAASPFPSSGWIHDEWLAILAACFGRIDTLEEALVEYRQHGGNQIGARKRSWIERISPIDTPRRQFIAATATRITAVLEHICTAKIEVDAQLFETMLCRRDHALTRSTLPKKLIPRLRIIMHELNSQNYHRFGSGMRSIVSDVLNLQ